MKTAALKRAKLAASDLNDKSGDKDGAPKKKLVKKDSAVKATDDEANDDAEIAVNDKSGIAVDDNGTVANDDNIADKTNVNDSNATDADRKTDADKIEKKKLKVDDKEKRKKHVRLWCVHCRIECATFKVKIKEMLQLNKFIQQSFVGNFNKHFLSCKYFMLFFSIIIQEYNNHLHSRGHKARLSKYRIKQEARLAQMRLVQRTAQNELEGSMDTEKVKPQFCLLCHLYYRTPKDEHRESESHRKMKQFLLPYCTVCRIPFKSPMAYETHRCSVDHLRVTFQLFEPKTVLIASVNQF